MALCQSCRRFDIQCFSGKKDRPTRGIPRRTALDGAMANCNFCSFILDIFMKAQPDAPPDYWFHIKPVFASASSASHVNSGLGIRGLDICLSLRRLSEHHPTVCGSRSFLATAGLGTPALINEDISGPRPLDDPICEEFVESMKGWLHTCTQDHAACSKTISGASLDCTNARLPTRCLKIDELGSGVIKVHLAETLGGSGCYIALSHRWSLETERTKTTTKNYEDRKSGKQFDLPQLFKDTLLVAHKLGISYVWIDSICIIQDGNEWESECLKVADYYQLSTLTIAAAINTGGSGLALSKISSQLLPRLSRLPYRDKSGQEKGYFYLYPDPATELSQAYYKTLDAADLLKRGWVFQEWCLSRRIACFASPKPGQRIFFHCQMKNPMNELGDIVPPMASSEVGFWDRPICLSSSSLLQLWEHWQLTVKIYSDLNLSDVQKDRIIALAGVAKEFRDALRSLVAFGENERGGTDCCPTIQLHANDRFADSYVAGLWLRNIHTGLLWEQRCDRKVVRERVTGISTWSWGSIMIPVIWNNDMGLATCTCKLIGIISESGENYDESSTDQTPLSGIFDVNNRYAVIRLWGRLLPVEIRDGFGNESLKNLRTMPGLLSDDEVVGQKSNPKIRLTNARQVYMYPVSDPLFICGWGSFEHPNFQDFSKPEMVYALPISEYRDYDYDQNYLDTRNVIFLRKLEDMGSESFERVGVGKVVRQETDKIFASTPEREIRLC